MGFTFFLNLNKILVTSNVVFVYLFFICLSTLEFYYKNNKTIEVTLLWHEGICGIGIHKRPATYIVMNNPSLIFLKCT